MRRPLQVLVFLALLSAALPAAVGANALDRHRDPVVLTGQAIPTLIGAFPDRIVAFRWEAGWVQIPVQVDERRVADFADIYNDPTAPRGATILTYADPLTWTGADPDPSFDSDDELLFMAREAGDQATTLPEPAGAISGTGIQIVAHNPLNGLDGYVYVFRSDGSLDPGPGADPVSNAFFLLPSGAPYKTQYDTRTGPNPENTSISSAGYSVHFSDRWICNQMMVTAGGATGVDVLDTRKAKFSPNDCQRSETTFSNGEGAFIVNRQGPVRALRGYCGANSGPTTHRMHRFYEAREDVQTFLRVHPIPGIMDFFDYSPAASGMVYRNNLNTAGVTIDGLADVVVPGAIQWEMVTGSQGTLVMSGLIHTDIPGFAYTSYYLDATPSPNNQCSGDNSEYGASGIRVIGVPNTDPAVGAANVFETTRVIAYDGPGRDVAFAQRVALEAQQPLTATASPYVSTTAVGEPGDRDPGLRIHPTLVRDRARVAFVLPEAGDFSLRILDVAGRAVATLAGGHWSAGRHELTWSAEALAPGVYFALARMDGLEQRVTRFVVAR